MVLPALLPNPFFAGEIKNPKITPIENVNADNAKISLFLILISFLFTHIFSCTKSLNLKSPLFNNPTSLAH